MSRVEHAHLLATTTFPRKRLVQNFTSRCRGNHRDSGCAATVISPGTEIREPGMLDPRAVLGQARQGGVPASWRVFTKARGRVRGFRRGTSADPGPAACDHPGRKSKWHSASFADQYQTVQAFIEAYGVHQAFRNGGLYPS
jgi:hypothetical protein